MPILQVIKEPKEIAFVNSPQLVHVGVTDSELGQTIYLDLKVWTGHRTTSKPTTATYQLFSNSSIVTTSGVQTYQFEISKFIRTHIDENTFQSGLYNEGNGVWFSFDISDSEGSPTLLGSTKFATGGYGFYKQETNPGTTVTDENDKVYGEHSDNLLFDVDTEYKLPVFIGQASTNSVLNSTFGVKDFVTDFGLILNSFDSTQQIGYITLGPNTFTQWADALRLEYFIGAELKIYSAEVICTKGPASTIRYQNAAGAISELPINGAVRETINSQRTTYKRNVLDRLGEYDTTAHQTTTFNVNGHENYNVHTGWIFVESNQMIRELFISRFVWFLYNEEGPEPVTIENSNKKIKNINWGDRQIGYDLNIKSATPLINQIT